MDDCFDTDVFLEPDVFSDALDSILPDASDCLFSSFIPDELLDAKMNSTALENYDDLFNDLLGDATSQIICDPKELSVNNMSSALTDHDYLPQQGPLSPCASSDSGLSSTAEESLGSPTGFSTSSSSDSFEIPNYTNAASGLAPSQQHQLLQSLSFDEEEMNKALAAIDTSAFCSNIDNNCSTEVSPPTSCQTQEHMDIDMVQLLSSIQSGTPDSPQPPSPFDESPESIPSPTGTEVPVTASSGYPHLTLTPEEQNLLDKEGISLPTNMPLTRSEEKVLRAVRRRIRNKESARNSRKKKQVYVDHLEDRVKLCAEEKKVLTKRVKELEETNSTLLGQLKKLQHLVASSAQKPVKRSTCAMILALSFAFFLMPSYQSYMSGEETTDVAQPAPLTGHSRSLLVHDETVRKNMPFYKEALEKLVSEKLVDPQELAIQAYISREMKNETEPTEFVSVQLTKDKMPIISLHNHSKELPVRSGTKIKEGLHV